MMNELKLFSIYVEQSWHTDADILVLADSVEDAKKATERIVNLESYDDLYSRMEITAKEISILNLNEIKQKPDMQFIAQDKHGCFDYYEFDEFKTFISDEKLEELRIKKIEENNGQLSLSEIE
jgi:hypothetical protein